MWIGTFYGLFRVLKSEADQLTGPGAVLFYNHFTKANGFKSDEFLGEYGNTSLKLPDGRLLLCNAIGMVVFDPALVPVEQPAEQLSFGNVWIDGKMAASRDRLLLDPDFNSFSVEVLLPFMWNPYNLQVQYQLSGGGKTWTFLPEDRIISLNRLPGGEYTLTVRMLKGFGKGEFITSTFHFRVLPHWYETWWFFALLLLSLNLLLIGYFRYRSRNLKKQKKILEEEVESRTKELRQSEEQVRQNAGFKSRVTSLVLHDVRSPLFYLKKITLSIYKSTAGEVPEIYRDQLKELHLSVKEVSEYAQNLFAWVSSQQDDFVMKKSRIKLFDVFEELCGNYHLLAEQNQNTIGHSAGDRLEVETQADLLLIILRNLVDNAIKYTRGGRIMLSASPQEDGMHILVWDTGRGMSPEKVSQIMSENGNDEADTRSGMGYRYIKDLLNKMNGRLVVKSEKDVGSAVTIILPL
jgi:signal transduction histidine kinase